MAKRKSAFEKLFLLAVKEAVKASKKQARAASLPLPASISEDDYYITAGEINFLEPPDEYIELRTYSDTYTYPVAGESHQTATFLEVARMFPGQDEVSVEVLLVPFPQNPVDKFAVAVTYENMMLGYIPRHVAKIFSEYLGEDCGKCQARIFFERPEYIRCSVQLNVEFPPSAIWDDRPDTIQKLGSSKPVFSFDELTTEYTNLRNITLVPGESRVGWAFLNEGYSGNPWIQDCETLEEIGQPDFEVSWSFNVFCRSFGGQVKVQYKMTRELDGNLSLKLDGQALKGLYK